MQIQNSLSVLYTHHTQCVIPWFHESNKANIALASHSEHYDNDCKLLSVKSKEQLLESKHLILGTNVYAFLRGASGGRHIFRLKRAFAFSSCFIVTFSSVYITAKYASFDYKIFPCNPLDDFIHQMWPAIEERKFELIQKLTAAKACKHI